MVEKKNWIPWYINIFKNIFFRSVVNVKAKIGNATGKTSVVIGRVFDFNNIIQKSTIWAVCFI